MSEYFANRKFLVTGGAGFLGGHLTPLLGSRGAGSVDVVRSAAEFIRSVDAEERFFTDALLQGEELDTPA